MGALSLLISTDIIRYLQERKGLSIADIANIFETSPEYIKKVIKQKEFITAEQLKIYLNKKDIHFWEFALEAIPLNHLSEKAKNRIFLCQKLSKNIKKRK